MGADPPGKNCMTALAFVDTNIFVYRHDRGDPKGNDLEPRARGDGFRSSLPRSATPMW